MSDCSHCTFALFYNDEPIYLRDSRGRQTSISKLFSIWSADGYDPNRLSMCMHTNTSATMLTNDWRAWRQIFYVISYELHNDQKMFIGLLPSMLMQFKDSKYKVTSSEGHWQRIQAMENKPLVTFFIDILNDPLQLRHIFRSNKCIMDKHILSALIHIIISKNQLKMVKRLTITLLISTIKYWQRKHFIFAIDNGLCKIFVLNLKALCPQSVMMIGLLWKVLTTHDNKHDGNDSYFEKHFRKTLKKEMIMNGEEHVYDVRVELMQQLRDSEHGNEKIYRGVVAYKDYECGWPLCDTPKQKDIFPDKNICKGCKLIRYCCRNHQKKHWKYIHAQQCFRYVD